MKILKQGKIQEPIKSKLIAGECVKVVDERVLTRGKIAVLERFDKNIEKWEVWFENGWIDWYREDQIEKV